MKRRNNRITILQAVIMLLMSAAAACSLLPETGDKYYLVVLVFAWLVVTGAVSLVFPRVSVLFFSFSVFTICLWAILSISIFDFGSTMGNEFVTGFGFMRMLPAYTSMNSWQQFLLLTGLGLFITAGYLVLSYLQSLQKDYQYFQISNVDEEDIKSTVSEGLNFLVMTMIACVFCIFIISVLLNIIQTQFFEEMTQYPWTILGFGVLIVLILGGLLYGLSKRRR